MDPNRDAHRMGLGAGVGIFQAFVPTGAVGILAGVFILVVLGIATGMFEGPWLAIAVLALAGLAGFMARAVRREMHREDRRPYHHQASSLPADAELTDEERRDAMRRFDQDSA
jgi:hypothetical protein